MISARPVTADSGSPSAMPLAVQDQVGFDVFVFAGEHRAGAGEPRLHFVGDEHHVVLAAPVQQCGRKPSAGTMKPPSPDGLDDDRGQVVGADLPCR